MQALSLQPASAQMHKRCICASAALMLYVGVFMLYTGVSCELFWL